MLKLIQKIKDQNFSYGVKTKWMKFKSNDSLPKQTQEVYPFKFFPTLVFDKIQDIYLKVASLFQNGSDVNLENEDEENVSENEDDDEDEEKESESNEWNDEIVDSINF